MSYIGNFIWFIFGGFVNWLVWMFWGVLWSLTIIGIPVGRQCFKIARISAFPFGKSLIETGHKTTSTIFNILWLIFGGVFIAISHLLSAFCLAITIIGIPFALQQLKLAKISLMPFGLKIVNNS